MAWQETREPPQSSASSDAEAVSRARQLIKEAASLEGSAARRWDTVLGKKPVSSAIFVEIVARLDRTGDHDMAVEVLQSAIRRNQAQAWMYSVLPLEMQLAKRPQEEIDRALLSRVDFAGNDVSQMLIGASLLSRMKSWEAAIDICREATRRDPSAPEPWLLARSIADRSGRPDAILWSRTGILQHVWTSEATELHKEARQAIEDLLEKAQEEGPQELVSQIREERQAANSWDLVVTARWAGTGDVDLSVVEPGDITCDRRNKVTKNGGILSQTSGGGKGKRQEQYRCQKAPSGDYEVVLKLIQGTVVTGNVVLRVSRYIGSDHEQTSTLRVPVTVDDGRVKIPVGRGRG